MMGPWESAGRVNYPSWIDACNTLDLSPRNEVPMIRPQVQPTYLSEVGWEGGFESASIKEEGPQVTPALRPHSKSH